MSQLVTEINRVADTTKYNGTTLLDGTYASSGLTFQVGADNSANDRMAVTIADFNTAAIGAKDEMAVSIGAFTESGGGDASLTIALTAGGTSTNIASLSGANKTTAQIQTAMVAGIASLNTTNGNSDFSITGTNGTDMKIVSANGTSFTVTMTLDAGSAGGGSVGSVAASTVGGAALTSGTASAASTVEAASAVDQLSVATQAGAQTAMDIVDRALKEVNSGRASMGAFQSRFESVVSNLNLGAENATAGRSRVQDADFAVESANLAKNQVLQQAGMSVLAQANALPQQVLALLQ